MQRMANLARCGGSIEAQFGKVMTVAQLAKTIYMIVFFYILSKENPMID